ncbi:MAG: OmpH family outer membrane protein [Gemmataceae bacterium]|nr:OmpH family outer membrane protein [Gemmataceae bacterium]
MKRTFCVAAGMLVLGLAIASTARLSAQGTGAAAAPKSKIALFNLTYVLKYYKKFTTFEAELKTAVASYQAVDTDLRKKAEDVQKELAKAGTTPEQREGLEGKIKEFARQAEDNKAAGSKALAKKQEEQLKILFMDVRTVAARYAAAHGYDVVMHYNDAIEDKDYYSGPNIARKLQAGALMPIFMANGVDISRDLVGTLNQMMEKR